MTLILEITKADGSVVTMPMESAASPYTAQAGEHFRVIDQATGQTPQGLSAVRDGNDLIIDGVPDSAAIALCDFYIHGSNGCVLTLDGQQVIAPSAVPSVMVAQAKPADAAKKAAEDAAKKEGEEVKKDAETTAKPEAAAATPAPEAAAANPANAAVSEDAAAAAANPAFSASTVALGALAVVGLAAAAGGSGSDDPVAGPAPGPGPAPAPDAPAAITSEGADDVIGVYERLPEANGGNVGETGTIDFTGTADAGATINLDLQDSTGASVATGTTTAAADGTFTVSVPAGDAEALSSGVYSPVITQTVAGVTSAAATATDITVLPQSPNTVAIEGGDNTVTSSEAAGGLVVTGTTEPGAMVDVVITDGTSATVATAPQVTADSSGAFTATVAGVDALAGGSYTVQTTTTTAAGASDFPNNTGITIAPAVNAAAGGTAVGGSAIEINGSTGAETLVGDYGGALRNGGFDYWDTTDTVNAWDGAGTGQFIAQPAGDPSAVDSLGWTPLIGNPQVAGAPDHYNYAIGPGTGDPLDGRVNLLDSTWDTTLDNVYGGGGVTQSVVTAVGETYELVISVDPTSLSQNTVLQVFWPDATADVLAGTATAVATRAADGTWTGATEDAVAGTITITLPAATADASELSIVAHEEWYTSAGGTGVDGNTGLQITGVALTNASAAGDDTIAGDTGADVIFGQGGNDTLYGGTAAAADTDADTFVYSMAMDNGADVIMDFDAANDRIVVVDVADVDGTNSAFSNGTTSDLMDLSAADVMSAGVQEITLSADTNGDVVVTFGGGNASGSVVMTGVTYGSGAGQYDDVGDLISNNLLILTGDGFHSAL